MNVLVTGSAGFLGKNFVDYLHTLADGRNRTRPNLHIEEIYEFDLNNTDEELNEFCKKADWVVNLAGVNRPKDPDEFIKSFGAENFKKIIEASKTKFEYEIEKILADYNKDELSDRIRVSSEISTLISTYSSSVEREIYCQSASKLIDVPYESIKKDVDLKVKRKKRETDKREINEIYLSSSGIGDRINPEKASNLKLTTIEESILGMMQLNDSCFNYAIDKLKIDDFKTEFNKRVFSKMVDLFENRIAYDISYFSEVFTQEEVSKIFKMKMNRFQLSNNSEKVLDDYIRELKQLRLSDDNSIDSLVNMLKNKA